MVEQNFALRRTAPNCGRDATTQVDHTPDRPPVVTTTFTLDTVRRDETRVQGPEFKILQPLIPYQIINVGGGRAIGGGTSQEAVRRARKKANRRA